MEAHKKLSVESNMTLQNEKIKKGRKKFEKSITWCKVSGVEF